MSPQKSGLDIFLKSGKIGISKCAKSDKILSMVDTIGLNKITSLRTLSSTVMTHQC